MKPTLSDPSATSDRAPRAHTSWPLAAMLALSVTFAAARPANDNFSDSTILTGPSGTTAGSTVDATWEDTEPYTSGGKSIWYQWTAPATGMIAFDTFGSDFDSILRVYTGASLDSLTSIVGGSQFGSGSQNLLTFDAVAGTVYRIVVDGFTGISGTVALHWWNPLANDNFASAAVLTGVSGTVPASNAGAFKEPAEPVHAANNGGASLWWKWTAPDSRNIVFDTFDSRFDTLLAVYAGGTLNTLTPVASNNNTGPYGWSMVRFAAVAGTTYHIAVDGLRSGSGPAKTGKFLLSWGAPLANDDFDNATILTGSSGSVSGRTERATFQQDEPNHADSSGGASAWWQWTATETADVAFDTFGSRIFDTILAVYAGGPLGNLILMGANDDFDVEHEVYHNYVTFTAVAGTTYHIAVDGFAAEMGAVRLNWGPPPANDLFALATLVTGPSGTATARTTGATREPGEPLHAGVLCIASLWWQWTAPADGIIAFDTLGSEFDTALAVYTGDGVESLTLVAHNDDAWGGLQSVVSFPATAGATYRIAVDGNFPGMGNVSLHWGPPMTPYTAWAAGFGLTGESAAPNTDPDSDGIPNSTEYVLGTNPAIPGLPVLPAVTLTGENMRFTFSRTDASQTPDVTLTVEAGTDLLTWPRIFNIGPNSLGSTDGVRILEVGYAPDNITVTIPRDGASFLFARLKVTITP